MGRGAEAQGPNRCINRAREGHCEAPVARRAQASRVAPLIRYHPVHSTMGGSMTFAKRIAGTAALGVVLLLGPLTSQAQAGYVVTLEQVGPNVVANGSGPIDLTGLTFDVSSVFQA